MIPDRSRAPAVLPPLASDLPPELDRFFRGSNPRTMTIRGPPGAGKTTLAASILGAFDGHRILVSASVPRALVLEQFPWLADGPAAEVIEFLRFRSPAPPGAESVAQLRDALQARASDLVDLARVLSLPPQLHEALRAHAAERKLVVIDSWEAWIENLLGPTPLALDVPTTRWELERSLLGQILESGSHVVLVAERAEPSRFDFVADATVALTSGEVDGRLDRRMLIGKLRGTQIRSTAIPFTLARGRFFAPPPLDIGSPERSVVADPDPEPSAPSLWPGSAALSEWFGRIPPYSILLLEADAETPLGAIWELVAPMVLTSLASGGRAVVRPPESIAAGLPEIHRAFVGATSESDVRTRLRLAEPAPMGSSPVLPSSLYLEPDALVGSYGPGGVSKVLGFLAEGGPDRARNLAVLFPEENGPVPGGPAHPEPLLRLPSEARAAGVPVATVIGMREDDPMIEWVRVRSLVHIAVRTLRGHLLLYGVRPYTPLLYPVPSERAGPPVLVPIV